MTAENTTTKPPANPQYEYIYDPSHQQRPLNRGAWQKTEKGWSLNPNPSQPAELVPPGQASPQKALMTISLFAKIQLGDATPQEEKIFYSDENLHTLSRLSRADLENFNTIYTRNRKAIHPLIRQSLAQNPNLLPEELDDFLTDDDPNCTLFAIQNKNISNSTLKAFALGREFPTQAQISTYVHCRKHCPEVLEEAQKHLQCRIGNNPYTPKYYKPIYDNRQHRSRCHQPDELHEQLAQLVSPKENYRRLPPESPQFRRVASQLAYELTKM